MKRLFTVLLLTIMALGVSLSANTLKKISVKNNELRLSFSSWIDSDSIKQLSLDNPPRQVIDFKNVKLKNKHNLSSLKAPGVKAFRIAERGKDLRIVIETKRNYRCRGYQPMASRTTYRIPLPGKSGTKQERKSTPPAKSQKQEVKKSPPKAKKSASEAKASKKKESKQSLKKKSEKKQIAKKKSTKKKSRRKAKAQVAEEESGSSFSSLFSFGPVKPKRTYTIVVDPGHGGHDSGATSGGKYEKDLVLQIALRTTRYLKKRGFRVRMTRSSDRFVKLRKRTHFANLKKADIFVSIHANAIANKRRFGKVYGVETYFLQTTRSAKAKRIAAIENSVVLDKNDYLSNNVILNAVLSGPKIELSHKLAIDVQRKILKHTRQKYRRVKDGGVKPAPFWVLVGAQMPSILVEVGYITNPIERRRLSKPDYQNRVAKGIVDGITSYLLLREKEMF